MIQKLIILCLAIAVFVYALYLVARQKGAPELRQTTGLRRRFLLATALCVAFLGGCDGPKKIVCYECPPAALAALSAKEKVWYAMRTAWLTMDPKKGKEFRQLVEEGVKEKLLDDATAGVLAATYDATAWHHWYTRGGGQTPVCYGAPSGTIIETQHADRILQKIDLLREAEKNGSIPTNVATKAEAAIIREITILELAGELNNSLCDAKKTDEERKAIRAKLVKIKKEYTAEELPTSESAKKVAKLIVEFETKENKQAPPVEKKAP